MGMNSDVLSRKKFSRLAKLSAEILEAEMILEQLRQYSDAVINNSLIAPGTTGDINPDIADLEENIIRLHDERAKELESLEQLIITIPDTAAQTYMRLHYIRGLSWADVATITGATSAGAAWDRVQDSLRVLNFSSENLMPAFSRKTLTDFAKLSANLHRKELALDSFRQHLNRSAQSMTVSEDDILELQGEIEQLHTERKKQLATVDAFILTVNEPIVQTYMRLHYIRGMTWDKVAQLTHAVSGCAVRTRVVRYVKAREMKIRDMEKTMRSQNKRE